MQGLVGSRSGHTPRPASCSEIELERKGGTVDARARMMVKILKRIAMVFDKLTFPWSENATFASSSDWSA